MSTIDDGSAVQAIDIQQRCEALRREIARVVVGQEAVVEQLLITLLARGHALFEGVPGLGKTRLVRSLAQVTSCSMARIQFTPDLMPADVTGSEILVEDAQGRNRTLRFARGPLFANLVLADEINRATPRTQAALLEAMEERHVTAGGQTHLLPLPFHVFATQNPIEQEGTYPLPEAQVDRFMFRVLVDYPDAADEARIADETTRDDAPALQSVLDSEALREMQARVRQVPVAPSVTGFAVALARATRPGVGADAFVDEQVDWGAGPRASRFLVLGARARALLQGRDVASSEDVRALAHPVLEHRVLLSYRAHAEGVTQANVVEHVLRRLGGGA
jgi:MoxR-like ATPase